MNKQKPLRSCVCCALCLVLLLSRNVTQAQSGPRELLVDADHVTNTISPHLYGQFVEEFFGDVDGPLWDELLRDRSFEQVPDEIGLPRYWDREPDDRNHDPAMRFHWDSSVALTPSPDLPSGRPAHSLKIDIANDQHDMTWRRGISQKRIDVRRGISYRGHLWIRSENFRGHVTVALEEDEVGGATYASRDLPVSATGWTEYPFDLKPSAEDHHAKFSILVHGIGSLWLDGVSLMPSDAVSGARADVFGRVKALRPFNIRWPGGNIAQNYHWWWGIGPRDARPQWIDHAWWQEMNSNDLGTDEYLALSKALGTEPSIVVNVDGDGATPEEAAAWVEYVNGPATSKWGMLRSKNGHPEPYHVRYWEIGNEVFGKWEIGHSDAAAYARNLTRYVNAMRAVDPNIFVIACGAEDMEWNRELLRTAGPNFDQIAIHHYYGDAETGGDMDKLLARPEYYGHFYAELRQAIHDLSPHHPVTITVNEWNTALPLSQEESMLTGVYAGLMMNQFERNGDLIESSAVSDMVNGWMGGVIQSAKDGRLYVTPAYLVNQMYNDHLGAEQLRSSVSAPPGASSQQPDSLDVNVSRDKAHRQLIFKIVNRSRTTPTQLHVHVAGANLATQGQLVQLSAAERNNNNTFAAPDAIHPQSLNIKAGNDFSITVPKLSVTVCVISSRHP